MGEKERILDHLENDYTEPIRDPVWKHIYVSKELLKIVELEPFQKLCRIKQLGPAHFVYPGATHTRLSHSLGVFHLARRMAGSLVRRGGGVEVDLEGIKAFLCAALLHDIGHYPFAHSLKDIGVQAHERLTAARIIDGLGEAIRSALGVEPSAVAAIIDRQTSYDGSVNVPFFRKILSGGLDPDKLDYLNRDAYYCGVPYGLQDVDFLLEEAYPHPQSGVAISTKGITALEDVLFSKYLMYKTVYWHKTVRIATAMIKKAICAGLSAGAISRDDLYGLDDEEFYAGFTEKRFPGFHLIAEVRRRELYKQVFRIPFHQEWEIHRGIENVEARLGLEERIAREASVRARGSFPTDSIVIDLPERISFEMEIPVLEAGGRSPSAPSAPSIFACKGAEDFPQSLRCITVNARRDEETLAALGGFDFKRFLSPS
jgi:HD superfamily phosphohydrolase